MVVDVEKRKVSKSRVGGSLVSGAAVAAVYAAECVAVVVAVDAAAHTGETAAAAAV